MRPAEMLLTELGVTSPADIDIDAIALCVGAEIYYRDLVGCEAEIIGRRNRAIIYVRKDTTPTRRRFSSGHELGHWHHHKGQSFICRPDDIGRPTDETSRNAERIADAYSADLLLPPFMFGPMLNDASKFSLDALADLANIFSVSLTATAIRAMRMTREPVMMVAHNLLGRRWQWPSISAMGLRVRDDLDPRSSAYVALDAAAGRIERARREPASYWFDRRHIEQFDLQVQSARTHEGETLTLLRILDQRMIDIYA